MRRDIGSKNYLQLSFYKLQEFVFTTPQAAEYRTFRLRRLTGGGCCQAYVHFAHALKLETNNSSALKGRQARNSRAEQDMLKKSQKAIRCVNGSGVKHFQYELHITNM